MVGKKIAKRAVGLTAGAGVLIAASPALALAEEEGGIGAILPKMDEFIPMLIAFIILWIILAKFGWPLFEGILNKREATVRDSLEKSEAARIESERLLAERQAELDRARSEVSQIIVDARKNAEDIKTTIEAEARAEAKAIVDKAHASIAAERVAVAKELQRSVADLSVEVAGRLIGEDLSDEEHRRIIERYVQEAGNLNAG